MAIQKEIWQRTIIEGLFADNTFAGKAVNDDAYVNQGKTVHIPNAGSPSKVVINRTTIPASASERTDADVDYSLDELTTDPVHIPHADTVELSYDKRNSVISQDRQKLIEEASQNLLYKWNPYDRRRRGGAHRHGHRQPQGSYQGRHPLADDQVQRRQRAHERQVHPA